MRPPPEPSSKACSALNRGATTTLEKKFNGRFNHGLSALANEKSQEISLSIKCHKRVYQVRTLWVASVLCLESSLPVLRYWCPGIAVSSTRYCVIGNRVLWHWRPGISTSATGYCGIDDRVLRYQQHAQLHRAWELSVEGKGPTLAASRLYSITYHIQHITQKTRVQAQLGRCSV